MSDYSWKRARSPEQVETRVNQILEASAKLFRSTVYEEVTMLKIAAEAGFTRSNIYRYFTSREEIFLALYMIDFQLWADEVQDSFDSPQSTADFLTRWIEILKEHQRLIELTPLLNTSLERNASRENLIKVKSEMARISQEILGVISFVLPDLPPESIFNFLRTNIFLIAGTWPASNRTPLLENVLDELKLHQMKIEFFPYMEQTLGTYLAGMASDSE